MRLLLATTSLMFVGCADGLKDALDSGLGNALECVDVCAKIEACGEDVSPPTPSLGDWNADFSSGGLDCAANCVQPERAYYGYSDCQLDCLLAEECGSMNSCWDVSSAEYSTYCLQGVETTPVTDDDAPEIGNGTNSGSEDADNILDNPAVQEGVENGGTEINFGENPPEIKGLYQVIGEIDASMNARPIGSPINTSICFWGQKTLTSGTLVNYCETAVPGEIDSIPVTGSGNNFTIYLEYPGQATILFSGSVDGSGNVENAEALVVYLHGIDIWEHSYTDWTNNGSCSGCD